MPDSPRALLQSSLEDLGRRFRANRDTAAGLCRGLDAQAFNWQPDAQRWSVALCLAHLIKTGEEYAAVIRPTLQRARARGALGSGPFHYGFLPRWFLGVMEQRNRKVKAPDRFQPVVTQRHDVTQVREAFDRLGDDWERLLRDAEGLHLGKVKVVSPVTRLLRFPVGSIFVIIESHERRHLWQAQNVTKEPGFPRPQTRRT